MSSRGDEVSSSTRRTAVADSRRHAAAPIVTVVVPVRDDAARIGLCLGALRAQHWPTERLEVIVVDDGSTDRTRDVVRGFAGIRLIESSARGSYASRNIGIAAARGDVIAFTDSDCIPTPDWITVGVAALTGDPRIGLVAGAVEIFAADPDRPTSVELLELVEAFPQARYIAEGRFGATANVFTTRRVLDQVGIFDGALQSGGDAEWGRRVSASGWHLVYEARAVVRHPARRTWAEWGAKMARVYSGLRSSGTRWSVRQWSAPLAGAFGAAARVLRDRRFSPARRTRAAAAILRAQIVRQRMGLRLLHGWRPTVDARPAAPEISRR